MCTKPNHENQNKNHKDSSYLSKHYPVHGCHSSRLSSSGRLRGFFVVCASEGICFIRITRIAIGYSPTLAKSTVFVTEVLLAIAMMCDTLTSWSNSEDPHLFFFACFHLGFRIDVYSSDSFGDSSVPSFCI